MNIYVEIMLIYGITFLVSMFVAFIIWALAKLVDALPEESFSLKSLIRNLRQNVISNREARKQVLKEFRATQVKGSKDLNSYRYEHA